ncbi:RNA polymerase sigma factor [Oxalicibacterium flavum]|uniref:RNA polymerase sigma factor n=1 Tax=Oxalicibacterium flavum TaxID=179467 RepID=A0A8J2UN84_9BURK|nr:sigma-70 family RNA polymerase sigma factor [Oxalicibacterium flavum]GGC12709.1 RNA polymerase sigma factor [Oxalicibacterium flavum]
MSVPPVSSPPVESLYVEHHAWLCGWLNRRLHNSAEASDLAQDTFVRLLVAPASAAQGEHSPLREPRAYLATVARRVLINHLRRQSLEQSYLDALAVLPENLVPSPEEQVLLFEALQEIDAMLANLADKVRAVFVLSQIEGLTYAAIARELGIGERSVKRYMAQAMAECVLLAP